VVERMKKLNVTKANIMLYALTLFIIIFGDQITKIIVSSSMQLHSSQTIIDGFLYFTYWHNEGAAWGILEGKTILFLGVALIAGIGMIYYFMRTEKKEVLTRYGLVLVFSGMLGNVIDRFLFGYVRDFIDVVFLGYSDFPIFNIADMAVVIGVGILILEIILGDFLDGKRKKNKD
jgi:signal peptidase II